MTDTLSPVLVTILDACRTALIPQPSYRSRLQVALSRDALLRFDRLASSTSSRCLEYLREKTRTKLPVIVMQHKAGGADVYHMMRRFHKD